MFTEDASVFKWGGGALMMMMVMMILFLGSMHHMQVFTVTRGLMQWHQSVGKRDKIDIDIPWERCEIKTITK